MPRKVILGLAVSLDGFIEGPQGEYDWCFTDQDYGLSDFFDRIDAMFLGRKSWELLQRMETAGTEGFQYPRMTRYVFSNTMTQGDAEPEIVGGDIGPAVQEIKDAPGKDIWLFGGADLTTSLMNLRLVDELWLSIHPILLGSGKPLFSGLNERVLLELIRSKVYNTGLMSATYRIRQDQTG